MKKIYILMTIIRYDPNTFVLKMTSGAIRRLRNKKPTKSYLSALIDHIKFLKSLGFKFDSKVR